MTCHKSCYSSYTSVSRYVCDSNKRKSSGLLSSDEPPRKVRRSQVPEFVFKRDCLFCGEIGVPKDPKNPGRWVPVSQCETETIPGQPSFKQVILNICDARREDWSRKVEIRVNGAHTELPTADAQYHTHCYNNFRKIAIDSTKSDCGKPCIDEAIHSVINHMKAEMCVTWTVS